MNEPKEKRVRLRPETVVKLEAITTLKRWTDTEAVDALCDDYIARHGVPIPDPADQAREPAAAQEAA